MTRTLFALALFIAASGCAHEAPEAPLPQKHMVVAAHPLAAEAGRDILRAGGNATDAAIAVEAVLSLVEPQSSGLGGGAYMLHYDAKSGALSAYDGRETAPASLRPTIFLKKDGTPRSFIDAAKSRDSVGVPGAVALMAAAHKAHGKLPWPQLFAPAIKLAEAGFPISAHMHEAIARTPGLADVPAARALYFNAAGEALPAGTVIKNPAYAATLRRLAKEGPDSFYNGAVAKEIVAAVNHAKLGTAHMTRGDLAHYEMKPREALCQPYRTYRICGMPPSSSGGVTVLMIMKLLERFDLADYKPGSPQAVHLVAEAMRLAYADRDRYIGDPDFVAMPLPGLFDSEYIRTRSALIDPARSAGPKTAGAPPGAVARADMPEADAPSTSHFSIIDDDGNAVAMTASVETSFGSNLMAGGFILNNELTDFSFLPEKDGKPVANAPAPGKRPRSSMAPTIVFDAQSKPVILIGSPGGHRIISYVALSLVALIDWHMDMKEAVSLPHHLTLNGPLELEQGTPLEKLVPALEAMGEKTRIVPQGSGLNGIRVTAHGFDGAADPRREGVALGD